MHQGKSYTVEWQNAEQAVAALETRRGKTLWVDQKSNLLFQKDHNGWKWQVVPFSAQEKLLSLRSSKHGFQTRGFKTRKDVVEYVECIAGKNTEYNQDLSKLYARSHRVYNLPNTLYSLIKIHSKSKWHIRFDQQHLQTASFFETRKAAIQYLFDQKLLIPCLATN